MREGGGRERTLSFGIWGGSAAIVYSMCVVVGSRYKCRDRDVVDRMDLSLEHIEIDKAGSR